MFTIRPGQIKAARAILGWSQDDLALAARISVGTIRNIEQGNYPRNATLNHLREALENGGIEFLDCDGVKRRVEDVAVYQGLGASERFLEDMAQCRDSNMIAISKSQKMFVRSLGLDDTSAQLDDLNVLQNAKCLISEFNVPTVIVPTVEFRTITKFHVGPACYFVYKNRYAVVVNEDDKNFRYVVFKSPVLAYNYRQEFSVLWDMAFPVAGETRQVAGLELKPAPRQITNYGKSGGIL